MDKWRYRNALGDLFVSEQKIQLERERLATLAAIANKPAGQTNPLVYLIPILGIVVFGIIVIMKKRGK